MKKICLVLFLAACSPTKHVEKVLVITVKPDGSYTTGYRDTVIIDSRPGKH